MEHPWTPPKTAIEAISRDHPLDRLYLAQYEINETRSMTDKLTIVMHVAEYARNTLRTGTPFSVQTRFAKLQVREAGQDFQTVHNVGLSGRWLWPDYAIVNNNVALTVNIEAENIHSLANPDQADDLYHPSLEYPVGVIVIASLLKAELAA